MPIRRAARAPHPARCAGMAVPVVPLRPHCQSRVSACSARARRAHHNCPKATVERPRPLVPHHLRACVGSTWLLRPHQCAVQCARASRACPCAHLQRRIQGPCIQRPAGQRALHLQPGLDGVAGVCGGSVVREWGACMLAHSLWLDPVRRRARGSPHSPHHSQMMRREATPATGPATREASQPLRLVGAPSAPAPGAPPPGMAGKPHMRGRNVPLFAQFAIDHS